LPTTEDVQAAYRKLASQYHPDRGGDPAKMAELNAARDEALKECIQ
jgi:curved DNA-binding protein CbpA